MDVNNPLKFTYTEPQCPQSRSYWLVWPVQLEKLDLEQVGGWLKSRICVRVCVCVCMCSMVPVLDHDHGHPVRGIHMFPNQVLEK